MPVDFTQSPRGRHTVFFLFAQLLSIISLNHSARRVCYEPQKLRPASRPVSTKRHVSRSRDHGGSRTRGVEEKWCRSARSSHFSRPIAVVCTLVCEKKHTRFRTFPQVATHKKVTIASHVHWLVMAGVEIDDIYDIRRHDCYNRLLV